MRSRPGPADRFLDGNAIGRCSRRCVRRRRHRRSGRCAGCGREAVLAETHVYVDSPGPVVRCAGCEAVLLRVVQAPVRTWLDLRGLAVLQLATGGG